MMIACVAIYKIAKAWGYHARLTVLGLLVTRSAQAGSAGAPHAQQLVQN